MSDFEREMMQAELQIAEARANLAELEYKKRTGVLIEKELAGNIAVKAATTIQHQLWALPPRVAGICENLTAADIQKLLDKEIRKILVDGFSGVFVALGYSKKTAEERVKNIVLH